MQVGGRRKKSTPPPHTAVVATVARRAAETKRQTETASAVETSSVATGHRANRAGKKKAAGRGTARASRTTTRPLPLSEGATVPRSRRRVTRRGGHPVGTLLYRARRRRAGARQHRVCHVAVDDGCRRHGNADTGRVHPHRPPTASMLATTAQVRRRPGAIDCPAARRGIPWTPHALAFLLRGPAARRRKGWPSSHGAGEVALSRAAGAADKGGVTAACLDRGF